MNNPTRVLERLAIAAFRRGESWQEFFDEHRQEITDAEPIDRHKWHRLVRHLSGLVVSGNLDGRYPINTPCWEFVQQELFGDVAAEGEATP